MSQPPFSNQGDQIESSMLLDSKVIVTDEAGEQQEVFNSGVINIDWSSYNFARSLVETVRSTDERVVDLGGASIHAIFVETSAPIVLEFIQDAELRRFTIHPSVQPTDYYTVERTPSERPTSFQPGLFLATGSPITGLMLKGITTVKPSAAVVVAFAGYRT